MNGLGSFELQIDFRFPAGILKRKPPLFISELALDHSIEYIHEQLYCSQRSI